MIDYGNKNGYFEIQSAKTRSPSSPGGVVEAVGSFWNLRFHFVRSSGRDDVQIRFAPE
jgi:hypothetical protein